MWADTNNHDTSKKRNRIRESFCHVVNKQSCLELQKRLTNRTNRVLFVQNTHTSAAPHWKRTLFTSNNLQDMLSGKTKKREKKSTLALTNCWINDVTLISSRWFQEIKTQPRHLSIWIGFQRVFCLSVCLALSLSLSPLPSNSNMRAQAELFVKS